MALADFETLKARAKSGDPHAQFAFSALLAASDPAEARHWLECAAAQGHLDALFTLSAAKITGVGGEADLPGAIAGLEQARASGNFDALRLLAALTALGRGVQKDWRVGLSLLKEAVNGGDAAALREVAVLNFQTADGADDGRALLAKAAHTDGFAALLVRELKIRAPSQAETANEKLVERAFGRLATFPCGGAREVVCERPRAIAYRGAFDPVLCMHIIGSAMPRLRREQIVDDAGVAHVHPTRTAFGANLGCGSLDFPAAYAALAMSELAGLPAAQGEPMNILRYRPGEEYRVHHDFLNLTDPDLASRGQRIRTALVYLNEHYQGGETHFVEPDIRFSGGVGDALLFDNVDDIGEPDVTARHAGRPVTRGVKWLATIWFRDRVFAF